MLSKKRRRLNRTKNHLRRRTAPEDPQAARNAFRALLDLEHQPPYQPDLISPNEGGLSPEPAPGDNGGREGKG